MSRFNASSLRFDALLNQILTTPTLSPTEWFKRARQAFENTQYRTCIDLLDKAFHLYEHQTSDSDFDRRAAIHLRGSAHQSLGNYAAALTDFQQLVGQDPMNPATYLELARLHSSHQNWKAADETLSKGILRMDQSRAAPLFLERGKIAGRNKNYLPAIDDLSIAVYHLPRRAEPWYTRGLLKSKIRAFRAAIRDGYQSILTEPANHTAHYSHARILCRAERYRDALLPLSRAIELAPNYCAPVSLLGRVLVLLKRHREARIFLDKALEMGASDPATIQARQRAYTRYRYA